MNEPDSRQTNGNAPTVGAQTGSWTSPLIFVMVPPVTVVKVVVDGAVRTTPGGGVPDVTARVALPVRVVTGLMTMEFPGRQRCCR